MKRKLEREKKRGVLWGDESGQILVLVAFAAVFLIGMAALAVDVGHGLVVRNELQNAADASALAGAGNLNPSPIPHWALAESVALSSIAWNQSNGQFLSTCDPQSGYWNLLRNPAGLRPQGITPGTQDVPAVMVTVRKVVGQNGGEVPTWFARIFGRNSFPVQAQAVAVVSHPGYVTQGPLVPVAIAKELADQRRYGPGNPVIIGSAYHYPNSLAGQWTSLLEDRNNVTYLRGLIQNGTPQQINVGDQIWIQPGTQNTLYDNRNQPSISWFEGRDVLLPVVNAVLRDTTHAWAPVVGFVGFHIVSATGGSTKTISGYFVDGFTAPNTGGSGPNYGVWTPPHLVL